MTGDWKIVRAFDLNYDRAARYGLSQDVSYDRPHLLLVDGELKASGSYDACFAAARLIGVVK